VRPYLCVTDAAAAIDFYVEVFGAYELMRMAEPNGRVAHAELDIDGLVLQISDEYPDLGFQSPKRFGGSPVTLTLYVDDVDRVARLFVEMGGKQLSPVSEQYSGDRGAKFLDPFGHAWWIATRAEDHTLDQMRAQFSSHHV
jgi:PhnB protein